MNISRIDAPKRWLPPGLLQRLSRYFVGALEIELDDRRHRFHGQRAFDFCLSARTAVPAARIAELYRRSETELEAELIGLGGLETKMKGILADYLEQRISLRATLSQTGVMMISTDHDWRAIFSQLLGWRRRDETYLRIACERYLDYLRQRRDVIGSISLLQSQARHRAEADTDIFEPLQQTQAFSLAAADELALDRTGLQRLPQGEAVVINLAAGGELAMRLAGHHFALAHGRDWALIADNGQRYLLRDGVNSIGRSRNNSIVIDSTFRNVSRRHLLAHPVGGDTIILTDVSSCGTFVAPGARV